MEYRAAAGVAAHDLDAVFFHKATVDLGFRVLVAANDDRIGILPQDQNVSPAQILQHIFFKG